MPRNALSSECAPDSRVREHAYRICDGIDVQLLWHPADDLIWLSVDDNCGKAKRFEMPVPRNDALLGFDHAFAYAN